MGLRKSAHTNSNYEIKPLKHIFVNLWAEKNIGDLFIYYSHEF